jgi:hypothetical protein
MKNPGFYIARQYDVPVDFLSIYAAAGDCVCMIVCCGADVSASTASKREVAIGYVKNGAICLNPDQSRPVALSQHDRIVVLSFSESEYIP